MSRHTKYTSMDDELDDQTIKLEPDQPISSRSYKSSRDDDNALETAFQQTYGNPYESSITVCFSMASIVSSIAFGTWAFIIYSQNEPLKNKSVADCNFNQILNLLLANGIMDILLGVGLVTFSALGFMVNLFTHKYDFGLKVANFVLRILLTASVFAISVAISNLLWGDSCVSNQISFLT
jgi:hypothetical protein